MDELACRLRASSERCSWDPIKTPDKQVCPWHLTTKEFPDASNTDSSVAVGSTLRAEEVPRSRRVDRRGEVGIIDGRRGGSGLRFLHLGKIGAGFPLVGKGWDRLIGIGDDGFGEFDIGRAAAGGSGGRMRVLTRLEVCR